MVAWDVILTSVELHACLQGSAMEFWAGGLLAVGMRDFVFCSQALRSPQLANGAKEFVHEPACACDIVVAAALKGGDGNADAGAMDMGEEEALSTGPLGSLKQR